MNARIIGSREKSKVAEMERLRTRVSHDLLKNKLILGLFKLQAEIQGRVETQSTVAESIQELNRIWTVAREEAGVFADTLKDYAWSGMVLELPFMRALASEEKRFVAEILQRGEAKRDNRCDEAELRDRILAADQEFCRLVGLVTSGQRLGLESVERVRSEFEALCKCLAAHRLAV